MTLTRCGPGRAGWWCGTRGPWTGPRGWRRPGRSPGCRWGRPGTWWCSWWWGPGGAQGTRQTPPWSAHTDWTPPAHTHTHKHTHTQTHTHSHKHTLDVLHRHTLVFNYNRERGGKREILAKGSSREAEERYAHTHTPTHTHKSVLLLWSNCCLVVNRIERSVRSISHSELFQLSAAFLSVWIPVLGFRFRDSQRWQLDAGGEERWFRMRELSFL